MKKLFLFLFSIVLSFFAGGIGSYFTYSSVSTWYALLKKPFFNLPDWVFAPVWSMLYLLMGISLYIVLTAKSDKNKIIGIAYFLIQLILNTIWSIIFFGFRQPLSAFLTIIFLWIFIYLTAKSFYNIEKKAGYLFLPYIAWVSFAAILNLSIVFLN